MSKQWLVIQVNAKNQRPVFRHRRPTLFVGEADSAWRYPLDIQTQTMAEGESLENSQE